MNKKSKRKNWFLRNLGKYVTTAIGTSLLLSNILFNIACKKPNSHKIERIKEDGVEVVINHLEPYRIECEPTIFSLKEESFIDTERGDLAKIGLAEITDFNVDSRGNLYISSSKSD